MPSILVKYFLFQKSEVAIDEALRLQSSTLDLHSLDLDQYPLQLSTLNPIFHSNLRRLYLQNNNLKSLPDTFGTLFPKLKSLYLDHNGLGRDKLPSTLMLLDNLTKINISQNDFSSTRFPIVLCSLRNLLELWANDLKVAEISKEISQLKRLRVLGLRRNGISALPPEFLELRSLVRLSLGENRFVKIPDVVFSLPTLVRCTLDFNLIDEVPKEEVLLGAKELRYLSLRSNLIKVTPQVCQRLRKIPKLKWCQLDGNPQEPHGQFKGLLKKTWDDEPISDQLRPTELVPQPAVPDLPYSAHNLGALHQDQNENFQRNPGEVVFAVAVVTDSEEEDGPDEKVDLGRVDWTNWYPVSQCSDYEEGPDEDPNPVLTLGKVGLESVNKSQNPGNEAFGIEISRQEEDQVRILPFSCQMSATDENNNEKQSSLTVKLRNNFDEKLPHTKGSHCSNSNPNENQRPCFGQPLLNLNQNEFVDKIEDTEDANSTLGSKDTNTNPQTRKDKRGFGYVNNEQTKGKFSPHLEPFSMKDSHFGFESKIESDFVDINQHFQSRIPRSYGRGGWDCEKASNIANSNSRLKSEEKNRVEEWVLATQKLTSGLEKPVREVGKDVGILGIERTGSEFLTGYFFSRSRQNFDNGNSCGGEDNVSQSGLLALRRMESVELNESELDPVLGPRGLKFGDPDSNSTLGFQSELQSEQQIPLLQNQEEFWELPGMEDLEEVVNIQERDNFVEVGNALRNDLAMELDGSELEHSIRSSEIDEDERLSGISDTSDCDEWALDIRDLNCILRVSL